MNLHPVEWCTQDRGDGNAAFQRNQLTPHNNHIDCRLEEKVGICSQVPRGKGERKNESFLLQIVVSASFSRSSLVLSPLWLPLPLLQQTFGELQGNLKPESLFAQVVPFKY